MIVEVDGKRIDANLVIFDNTSLQIWGKKDGKMVSNIVETDIKRIIVETNE